MASASLTWTPGGGGGTQVVQYKLRSSGEYVTYSTLGSTATTETISSLQANTMYDFRIIGSCSSGVASQVSGSQIQMTCPTVTATPGNTSAVIEFPSQDGDVDGYIVELRDSVGNTVLQSKTYAGPFNTTLSATFTGLTGSTDYNIRIKPSSGQVVKADCALVPFTTSASSSCGLASDLVVNLT